MNLVPNIEVFPAALKSAMENYTPNPDTLKWTTTGAGGFFRGPLGRLRELGYVVPQNTRFKWVTRLYEDAMKRGIAPELSNPHILKPDFNEMKQAIDLVTGKSTLYNTWDALHFSIGAYHDAYKELGDFNLAKLGLGLVASYFVNANTPYLRCGDSDDPALMYGNGSRLRCAARCVQALVQAYEIIEHAPDAEVYRKQAIALLAKHIGRTYEAWPLGATVEKENGSPTKPSCRVFMLGHVWEAMDLFLMSSMRTAMDDLGFIDISEKAHRTMARCETLISHAVLPQYGNTTLAYDLAVTGTGDSVTVSIHEKTLTTPQPTGIGGVNQWLYPALKECRPEVAEALRANAIKEQWPTKWPLVWIDRIQERLP